MIHRERSHLDNAERPKPEPEPAHRRKRTMERAGGVQSLRRALAIMKVIAAASEGVTLD